MDLMTPQQLGDMAHLMAIPIFLAFVAMVVLLSDLIFDREDERRWPAYLTIAGLVGSLFLWLQSWLLYHPSVEDNRFWQLARSLLRVVALQDQNPPQTPDLLFGGMFDPVGIANFTLLATLLVVIVALLVTLMSPSHLERRGLLRGEFYALLLFATVGLILMAGSQHLILVFLGIELLSIPLYILAGFARPNLRSQEAALKYFLLGAFASSFLLYGIALIYGATGSMNLVEIRQTLSNDFNTVLSGTPSTYLLVNGDVNLMLVAGLTMLLVGIGFKISLVPFHQWTPDVYEGAPTPVTAFMVAGTKIGGFAMLVNVLFAFAALFQWWSVLIDIFALLTMAVGNIGALLQTNIKRMLAYSSIAHAGYMLVAVAGLGSEISLPALILYLAVYALMNLGVFAVLLALEEATGAELLEVEAFRGVGRTHPLLALLLGFFLLSLAGFPPTAGFFAKFFLFTGALIGNQIWLIVVAVVLSVLSLFYYARYIIAMFMQSSPEAAPRPATATAPATEGESESESESDEAPAPPRRRASWMVGTAVALTALLVLLISFFPTPLLSLF